MGGNRGKNGERARPLPISFGLRDEMPPHPISMATTEWNETGTWRYLKPRYVEQIPACQAACPTANDIESWIRLMEAGRLDEAWDAATLENPFPAIMGRVCFHPCMDGCSRREMGGAVNIKMLERALGDAMGSKLPPAKPLLPPTGKRVAVIGAGPAGLALAYHLTRLGTKVTVFERAPKAGGMLRYGIPAYRFPRDVLDREIARLAEMGIDIRTGAPVKGAAQMQELRQDYDALFMAAGAQRHRALGIPDEKAAGIISGLEFLKLAAEGKAPPLGKRALVVGGGNTAVDSARVALRQGAKVTILYRRSRAEMPAFEEEVAQALAEGVEIEELVSPVRATLAQGRVARIECRRMELGPPDESGRRRPVPKEGEEVSFDAEVVVVAIGEDVDTSIIPSSLPIAGGAVRTGPGGRTEWHNVFAGGDFVVGPRTVVDAIAAGKLSAIAMDCYLRGERFEGVFDGIRMPEAGSVFMGDYVSLRTGKPPRAATASSLDRLKRVARFPDLNPAYFTPSAPNAEPTVPIAERLAAGAAQPEVVVGPTMEVKGLELARCFHCGRCTECDNCYIYCPDVAIAKMEGGFEIDYFYCKGCGICPRECPRAAMEMIEEPTGG